MHGAIGTEVEKGLKCDLRLKECHMLSGPKTDTHLTRQGLTGPEDRDPSILNQLGFDTSE